MGALTDLAFYQDMARRLGHSVSEGAKEWIPDIAGFAGDIPDAAYYLAQRLKSPATPRTLGAGPAMRRAVRSAMGIQPAAQTETGLSEIPDTDVAKVLTQMLNPAMTANPRQIAAGAKVIGRLGAEAIARGVEGEGVLGKVLQGAQPAYIVKPKGGNWVSGSVEDALKGLKRPEASVEGLMRIVPEADEALLRQVMPDAARDAQIPGNKAINQWIEGPLTKYVKTRMASPEDEVRKLAEQGVLHFSPVETPGAQKNALAMTRAKHGFPAGGVGETPTARNWENLSDRTVIPGTYEEHLPFREDWLNKRGNLDKLVADYPDFDTRSGMGDIVRERMLHGVGGDFAVQNPDAPAFAFNGGRSVDDLGFSHLIDELKNALNPESGLPRNLLLTPEAVQNMSMEKAVRRVHDINEWRAAQKVEANRALAEKASVVREYAPSEAMPNPKGLRWVELKKQEALPEGWSLKPGEGEYAGYDWFFDPQGKVHNKLNDPRNKLLEDQLKYEGDTMGHCVGGYCDDVLSGQTRIFSLRDAKGEPHVTVEVAPPKFTRGSELSDEEYATLPSHVRAAYEQPSIIQIKGKQNRAPNEEYLPFVQDFVRNPPTGGQWSDVGDLQNTGLTKHPSGKYVSDAEAAALAQRHFGDVKMGNKPDDIENPWQYANRIGRYDPDMLSDTDKAFLADWDAGNFASGGRVTTPNDLHNLIAELESA